MSDDKRGPSSDCASATPSAPEPRARHGHESPSEEGKRNDSADASARADSPSIARKSACKWCGTPVEEAAWWCSGECSKGYADGLLNAARAHGSPNACTCAWKTQDAGCPVHCPSEAMPRERCSFVCIAGPDSGQRCWSTVGHDGPHDVQKWPRRPEAKDDAGHVCSFCGKTHREIRKMVAAVDRPAVICNECVGICIEKMGLRTADPKVIPEPHVTIAEGVKGAEDEVCFEWWAGNDKVTLYALPTTLLRHHGAEEASPATAARLVRWLEELPRRESPRKKEEGNG